MQQERRHVWPEFGDQERDALRHQPRDEVHVAAEPVELGDRDRRAPALAAGLGERVTEFRAPLERVSALARFDLDMLGDDLEALGLGESDDG